MPERTEILPFEIEGGRWRATAPASALHRCLDGFQPDDGGPEAARVALRLYGPGP